MKNTNCKKKYKNAVEWWQFFRHRSFKCAVEKSFILARMPFGYALLAIIACWKCWYCRLINQSIIVKARRQECIQSSENSFQGSRRSAEPVYKKSVKKASTVIISNQRLSEVIRRSQVQRINFRSNPGPGFENHVFPISWIKNILYYRINKVFWKGHLNPHEILHEWNGST